MLEVISDALVSTFKMKPVPAKSTENSPFFKAPTGEELTLMTDTDGIRRVTLSHKGYALLVARENLNDTQSYGVFAYVYAQERWDADTKFRIRDSDIQANGLLSGAMMRACEFQRLGLNDNGYDQKDTKETRAMVVLMMVQRAVA